MILTGKAKEDYTEWFNNKIVNEDRLDSMFNNDFKPNTDFEDLFMKTVTHSIYIEWFDSVGIYINILSLGLQSWFCYDVKFLYPYKGATMYKTRQQSTEQAIIKANQIYNEK